MYCQQFQGEVPPFEKLTTTHVICKSCFAKDEPALEGMIGHSRTLGALQARLSEASRAGDLEAARPIIEAAYRAGVRPVDIAMGVIAPQLFTIGQEWEEGVASVADEHRVTSFCKRALKLIEGTVRAETPAGAEALPVEFVLMNAPRNRHTLAIRILALWLVSNGKRLFVFDPRTCRESLAATLKQLQPRVALISLALPEQRAGVVELVQCIAAAPGLGAPRIVVGGNAVKLGWVEPIPGATLLADIHSL